MTLSIILAMTEEGVIGRDNKLPWHISQDLIRFKKVTMGHAIIMGRKTFESIGKPLPGRKNIVVTRNTSLKIDGIAVAHSLEQAIKTAGKDEEIFVIGGAALFEEALPIADRLYLTLIHQKISGDIYFRKLDLSRDFHIVEQTQHRTDEPGPIPFSFINAIRRQ